MNSSFPNLSSVMTGASDQQRPFAWIDELSAFLGRNWRLVAISVGTFLLCGVAYLCVSKPRFTATALLLVDERQSEILQQHSSVGDAQIQNARIESDVEILRSAGLARQVVTKLDLADDPHFTRPGSLLSRLTGGVRTPAPADAGTRLPGSAAEDRLVAQFLSAVVPHRIGLTYVIQVDATATSPALAARLANGMADAYLSDQSDVKDTSARRATGWLQGRLVQLQDQALQADQAVQSFKSASGIVDTGHGLLNEQQLVGLNEELVAARGKTAEAVARVNRLRQLRLSGHSADTATSDMLQSPVINTLREHYLTDSQRVAEWSARFGHDHGAAVVLRKEMVQLQSSIDSEVRRIEATAQGDVDVDRAAEAAIQAQLDAVVRQSAAMDRTRATLRSLQSSADTYRSLYVALLQRSTQTAQEEAFPVADARMITQARPPLTKSRPQGKLILVGAAIVGLAVGFVAGFLRDALDQRIRSASDLMRQTGLSCLTSLPVIGSTSAGRRWPNRDRDAGPPDTAYERQIRRLQLRLRQLASSGGGRLIGLVSPTAGAGTTTVTSDLVQSLLECGHDAVLLDLSDTADLRGRILDRMELLRRSHEFVVIDFPPLSRPSEAHTTFVEVGEVALLLDANRLDGRTLLRRLRDGGLDCRSLSGVVLNKVRCRIPA